MQLSLTPPHRPAPRHPRAGRPTKRRSAILAGVAIGASIVLAPAAACAQSAGEALLSVFPRGEESCFGRVYDAAHLAAHPRQRMTAFHLFKSLTPDVLQEEGYRSPDGERAHDKRERGARWLSVLVRFRDRPGRVFGQTVECQGDANGFYCGRDCDGGGFHVRSAEKGGLLLDQDPSLAGLRLAAACDADETGENERLDPGRDAVSWKLQPLPMSACRAERDAARPSWVKSLSSLAERLVDRSKVCHSRIYDKAHLARHPEQRVAAIALQTEDRVRREGKRDDFQTVVPIRIAARLRDGSLVGGTVKCTASEYAFVCSSEKGAFTLVRSGERGIEVRDLNALKAIDPVQNTLGDLLGATLGDDDRVFRMNEEPDASCTALMAGP